MKRKAIYIILLTGILSCQVQQKEQTTEAVSKSQSIERYEAINQQLNATENCIICDSTQIFKTVEDVLNMTRFKNKVVYLDFWGTRCSPCIEEFKFLPDLKNKFQNEPVEYLYIVTYDEKKEWNSYREKLWKMLIAKHKLTGVNLLISKGAKHRFYAKYSNIVDPKWADMVPVYLLFNKQGKVVNFVSPRPSSKEVLYSEIQELLNEQ
ncbi:MAG: redoxin family protein [Prolixibacteraceae bacterium]|nr:redoxin family protein [Prolixibacteraceae bacterium]